MSINRDNLFNKYAIKFFVVVLKSDEINNKNLCALPCNYIKFVQLSYKIKYFKLTMYLEVDKSFVKSILAL
jgi:hypothetical protein